MSQKLDRKNAMRYHLIAVGGSVMHNVAIDLKDLGHQVSGSDDEIYEPSKSRLARHGLLPETMGWDSNRITKDIDKIILGKHAKKDNPELIKAMSLGIPIVSFPEFIADATTAQTRISIAGSHGKTSTTAMIMHALRKQAIDFDYLVGANLKGFEKMVKLSGAGILVVEADEYPSSCLDNRAKMLHYKANICVITGIAWDHVNIYKTYDAYKDIFHVMLSQMGSDDICYFDQTDEALLSMMINNNYECVRQSYLAFETNKNGEIVRAKGTYPIGVFGQHNLQNMKAAMLVCENLGIDEDRFLKSMADFTGAAKRLELLHDATDFKIYKDFAHAPSKCRATVDAVRQRYQNKRIRAVLELHTFSSLSNDFIAQYKDTMHGADEAVVFYDPHAVAMKQMPEIDDDKLIASFGHPHFNLVKDSGELQKIVANAQTEGTEILLIMSSGNLGGIKL
jgi:UDP-N-acetylmuramate: L-alanyl-gamma-D-glutamyl-meso-diaminopimelate ligase